MYIYNICLILSNFEVILHTTASTTYAFDGQRARMEYCLKHYLRFYN